MPNLLEFRQNLEPLTKRDELVKIALEVVFQLRAYLIDLNQIQLSEGKDAFGNIIGTYSPATEFISQNPDAGQVRPILPKNAGDPYNFEWTGDFFNEMTMVANGKEVIFTSTDSKTPLLTMKYKDLFGLTDENMTEAVTEKILPAFVEVLCSRLGI